MHKVENIKGRMQSGRAADDAWEKYSMILEKESGIRLSVSGVGKAEPFALMNYEDELKLKKRALEAFLGDSGIRIKSCEIIPSPEPRHYRTTTKRRTVYSGNRIILAADESSPEQGESLLEPAEHGLIYRQLSQMLCEQVNRKIGRSMNFMIIRGSYTEFALIFNMSALGADIVKGCTMIAERLKESVPFISSAFIYHDPSASKYYFESIQSADGLRMKRLFGHAHLAIRAGGMLYTFHPAGFSQVNLSMADTMLGQAGQLLDPPENAELVDLYCGYGFFTCFFACKVSTLTGIDYDHTAVEYARSNMKRLHSGCRYRFTSAAVEPEIISKILPRGRSGEYFLLDPPRRGTQPGVIETIAERKPARVLHVFCGIENIPSEIKRWINCGYRVKRVSALDMFAGTPNLEIMVLLE